MLPNDPSRDLMIMLILGIIAGFGFGVLLMHLINQERGKNYVQADGPLDPSKKYIVMEAGNYYRTKEPLDPSKKYLVMEEELYFDLLLRGCERLDYGKKYEAYSKDIKR